MTLKRSYSTALAHLAQIAQINQKHLQSKIIPNKSIKNCAQTQKFTYNFNFPNTILTVSYNLSYSRMQPF